MTALALILQTMGKTVTGSDLETNYLTDELLRQRQIRTKVGFNPKNLGLAQVVIYGAGHQASHNPIVSYAQADGLACFNAAEVIGWLTGLKKTVAVAGCHGKTTTTALISYCLQRAGEQPSYLVGSAGFMGETSGAWGKGDWLVVEADEYLADPFKARQPKFWYYTPKVIVATNLDFDHPDFFDDFEAVKQAFTGFFQKLKPKGKIIVNGDDAQLLALAKASKKPVFSFGYDLHNLYRLEESKLQLRIFYGKRLLTTLSPKLFGRHNYLNLGAGVAFLHQAGYEVNNFTRFLNEFKGAKRRLELIGKIKSNWVYDDYAHHPTEIKASLEALRNYYPSHKLAVFFQLHTYSRTQKFIADFAKSLSQVDYLGLLPIFASAREQSVAFNLQSLLKLLPNTVSAQIMRDQTDFIEVIKKTQAWGKSWVYVTMGAGDINNRLPLIIKTLKKTVV